MKRLTKPRNYVAIALAKRNSSNASGTHQKSTKALRNAAKVDLVKSFPDDWFDVVEDDKNDLSFEIDYECLLSNEVDLYDY